MKRMKKLISLISLTLAGASAFAITDTQKTEFIELSKTVKGGEEFALSVESLAKTDIAKAIGLWAKEEPLEYWNWILGEEFPWKWKNGGFWIVRLAVNEVFLEGSLQDAAINDYRATYDRAMADKSYYEQIKAKEFAIAGGIKFPEWKIWNLAKKYSDLEVIDTFPEKYISERFGEYLTIIRKARLNPEVAYKLYVKISTNFAEFKDSVKAVKDNWESLQADKNEAFMDYYAKQKLETLNK